MALVVSISKGTIPAPQIVSPETVVAHATAVGHPSEAQRCTVDPQRGVIKRRVLDSK